MIGFVNWSRSNQILNSSYLSLTFDRNVHNVYKPKTQAIMDKAVHGKSTPKITDNMYINQFPLEGLL